MSKFQREDILFKWGDYMKWKAWQKSKNDDIVRLWNQELGEDFPMRQELFEQNSFDDVNVCHEASKVVVGDHNEVIGFIVAKKWQEPIDVQMPTKTGWIQVLVVDKRYRGQGIGSELLRHAEKIMKSHGMDQVLLGRDPQHYFPGIPRPNDHVAQWFESKGYTKQDTEYDVSRSYDKTSQINQLQINDVEFGLLKEDEKDAFLGFLRRCFPGRWEYEAIKYFELNGTGREFVVIRKHGKIIGFCRVNDSKSPIIAQNVYWAPLFQEGLGGIGPLGVDAEERGQGFGLAVVEAGIIELRKRGVQNIVIDWTGLIDFYKKLGYDIWKTYDSYKKEL